MTKILLVLLIAAASLVASPARLQASATPTGPGVRADGTAGDPGEEFTVGRTPKAWCAVVYAIAILKDEMDSGEIDQKTAVYKLGHLPGVTYVKGRVAVKRLGTATLD